MGELLDVLAPALVVGAPPEEATTGAAVWAPAPGRRKQECGPE